MLWMPVRRSRRYCSTPPTNLGAMKACASSICRESASGAEQLAPPFDQHVGHLPLAKLGQQGVEPFRVICARQKQHFAARNRRPLRCFRPGRRRRRRQAAAHLARRAHQLADPIASEACVSSTTLRGDARPSRTSGEQRIVGSGGPTADQDCIDPTAQLVDDLSRSLARDPAAIAGGVASLPSSVMAHLAITHGAAARAA